jgi:hypothetical protein
VVKNGLLRGLDTVESDADFAERVVRSVREQMAPFSMWRLWRPMRTESAGLSVNQVQDVFGWSAATSWKTRLNAKIEWPGKPLRGARGVDLAKS